MSDDGSPGLRQRLRYRFDNLLARGTWAVLLWLGVVTFLTVLLGGLLLAVFGVSYTSDEDSSWLEDLWQTLMRVIDPGTLVGDVGWGRRILALAVTIFGILVAGTLIGVIAAGVEDRVDRMRRGRSVVIERDHVVVLGAADHLPFVIRELVHAPAPDRPPVIVVLADADPADIHAARRGIVDDLQGVRLVVRSGDPTRPSDLELVRLDVARSVIVLGDAADPVRPVRTALAVAATGGGVLPATTVVEVDDAETATRLVESLGHRVQPVVSRDAVARIAAFALRQPGLIAVVDELIDAPKVGIRISAPGAAAGLTFGSLVAGLQTSRPLGRIAADGAIELTPSFDATLGDGDRLVSVGADDDLGRSDRPVSPWSGHDPAVDTIGDTAHVVVAGWSRVGALMLTEWISTADPTSTLTLIAPADSEAARFADRRADDRIRVVATADEAVDRLGDGSLGVVVLLAGAGAGPAPRSSANDVDTDTLLTAGGIAHRLAALPARPRLVVELLDPDSAELASLTGTDDFVISDALASKFVVQLAIEPLRRDVLLSLYDRTRPDLVIVDGGALGLAGTVTMGAVVDRACEHGMLAIGWRDGSTGELVLAPPLSASVDWSDSHRLVVVR